MNEADKSLREHLEMMAKFHSERMRSRGSDEYEYNSTEELLLKKGRFFEIREHSYRMMQQKECFRNSLMMMCKHPELRYVEGIAQAIIPVHHAWNIDENDHVVDVTWRDAGTSYCGLVIPREAAIKKLIGNGCYLNDWQQDYESLRREWPF